MVQEAGVPEESGDAERRLREAWSALLEDADRIADEIAAALAARFPDVPSETIEADTLGLLQALFPRRVIRRVRLFQQLVALRWDLQQRSHTNHAGDRQSLGPNTSLNELLRKG